MSSKKLTGSKRIIHDCCVDIYNSVQKWRSVAINMHSTLLAISQLQQKELSAENISVQDQSRDTTTNELTSLIKQLQIKLEILESIINKMERTSNKLDAICKLSDSQLSSNSSFNLDFNEVPFLNWPVSEFCLMSKEIESMFKEELKTKTSICRELCILEDKSALCFFEACWKYEPSIDKRKLNKLLGQTIFELELQPQLT